MSGSIRVIIRSGSARMTLEEQRARVGKPQNGRLPKAEPRTPRGQIMRWSEVEGLGAEALAAKMAEVDAVRNPHKIVSVDDLGDGFVVEIPGLLFGRNTYEVLILKATGPLKGYIDENLIGTSPPNKGNFWSSAKINDQGYICSDYPAIIDQLLKAINRELENIGERAFCFARSNGEKIAKALTEELRQRGLGGFCSEYRLYTIPTTREEAKMVSINGNGQTFPYMDQMRGYDYSGFGIVFIRRIGSK